MPCAEQKLICTLACQHIIQLLYAKKVEIVGDKTADCSTFGDDLSDGGALLNQSASCVSERLQCHSTQPVVVPVMER